MGCSIEKGNEIKMKLKSKKFISVLLIITILSVNLFGCTDNINNQDNSVKLQKNTKNETILLNSNDMVQADTDVVAKTLDLYSEMTSKSYSYRESRTLSTQAPVKQESLKKQTVVEDNNKSEVLIQFNRVQAPDELLQMLNVVGNYGLRTNGRVTFTNKGINEYSQSMMFDETVEDSLRETLSEESFKHSIYKINILGPSRNELQLNEASGPIGYEGNGTPRTPIFTQELLKTIGSKNILNLAEKSEYLISSYKTNDQKQIQLVFDNSKIFKFMDLIEKELNKNNKKLLNKLSESLYKDGVIFEERILEDIPYDYQFTIENLTQFLFTNKSNNDNNILELEKSVNKELGKDFDKRISTLSFIIDKVGILSDGKYVDGDKDTIRHIKWTNNFTDFMSYNIMTTFIDYEISPDKKYLEENETKSDELRHTKTVSKNIKDINLLTTSKIFTIIQQLGDTELVREDVKNKMKKSGKDMRYIIETDAKVSDNIYDNLEDNAYIGMDSEQSKNRQWKVDPLMYWINRYVLYNNKVQDDGDNYDLELDVNGYKFATVNNEEYTLNNIYTEDLLNKLNGSEEDSQEEDYQDVQQEDNTIEMTNEELIKDKNNGTINLANMDYDNLKILNNYYKRNMYNLKLDSGKLIKDYIKDDQKPTVLMFGEHWCHYCKDTLKYFNKTQRLFDKYNFLLVTSGTEDEFKNDPEVDQYDKVLENVAFNETTLKETLPIGGFPTILLLDKDGNLISVESTTSSDGLLDKWFDKIK